MNVNIFISTATKIDWNKKRIFKEIINVKIKEFFQKKLKENITKVQFIHAPSK